MNATYSCGQCGISVKAQCAACDVPLENSHLDLPDGSSGQVSGCPSCEGKIKSPLCCGAYRRFNPTSGFWPSTYVVGGDTLQERVASSDLSRSNWCPGDDVQPLRLALGDLAAGEHTLEIAIPGAQAWTDSTFNFWNIAATLHHP